MLATEHTQSLSDFRKNAAATIERLNKSGNAEIITVNGEARAVLVAPAVYDQMAREAEIARDAAMIRRSRQEFKEGKSQDASSFFGELRTELLAMKAAQTKGAV
jgi:PHD/YefM family antitoxin component YafN of YafNO toxin-antitoxin module